MRVYVPSHLTLPSIARAVVTQKRRQSADFGSWPVFFLWRVKGGEGGIEADLFAYVELFFKFLFT